MTATADTVGATSGGPVGSSSVGAAASSGAGAGAGGMGPVGDPVYVFSTFGTPEKLLIYTSPDALNFTLLTNKGYAGPSGTLRDPSIMRAADGKYYVAFTTPPTASCCGAESSFSLAESADLVTWTTLTTVPAGITGVVNTWAPEFLRDVDGSLNLIVSVDTAAASSFKSYKYTALNAALTSWSGPTPLGIGPNYIDTFIVIVGGIYHAFTKNETTLYIEHATATHLNGPWTFVGTGDWAGWGVHREAPAVIELANGTYRIYMDGGSQGHELYSDSTDNFASWTKPQGLPVIGPTVSHGTVLRTN